MTDVSDSAMRFVQDLGDAARRNPVSAAMIGTGVENEYHGEASKAVKNTTTEMAGQQVEKAATVAGDVYDAATAEARKQGLTPDGARAAVHDITGRVSRVVDVAKKSAAEQAGS